MNAVPSAVDSNRWLITASIMLATIMTSLDTTIANVALPHMAGSVSASADQITWVLTSYIVAAAIMTPMTGWLANRFGRKAVFMISIAGFTLASALCGAAASLEQIVLFRLLQGVFGAALIPLSQAVLLDTFPPAQHGSAMAIWGMGAILGPIVGPALGGWLTEDFSWRWVFYINLPLGALALAGVFSFIHDSKNAVKAPFDFMGFILLSVAIGGFQLFLDRGADKAWFESTEIWIEASVSGLALVLFVFHSLTVDRPFIPLSLTRDGNFITATVFGFFIGVILYATMALLPPMMETLMGYPVVTTGLVLAPRGVGTLFSMFLVGQLVNRIDVRLIILTGLILSIMAFSMMTKFTIGMDSRTLIISGVVQGMGIGLIFVPLATLGFATLSPALRADGTGVFTLVRNLGSSVGISVMQALHTQNTQIVHSRLMEQLRPDNPMARTPWLRAPFSLTDPAGLAALNNEVNRQASMVAYLDDFRLMLIIGVVLIPTLLLMRPPSRTQSNAQILVE